MAGWKITVVAAVASLLLAACKDSGTILPRSGGQPFGIVVAGRTDTGTAELGDIMRYVVAEALPQAEPAYDVAVVPGGIGPASRYARTVVMADVDSAGYDSTRIVYERNVYARPQLIVYVCTPSVSRMKANSARIQAAVGRLIDRFELGVETAGLRKAHNRKAEAVADSMFGHRIWIPSGLDAMKTGKDFVWFSDNSATAMRNVCIYSYPGLVLDAGRGVRMRDSVMRANIPGETPQMYMTTVSEGNMPAGRIVTDGGRRRMEMSGLWEMSGDAMGGPFVSHSITDSANGRIIVAEAFVFAPGKKKRNLIRQLEAALYTLK